MKKRFPIGLSLVIFAVLMSVLPLMWWVNSDSCPEKSLATLGLAEERHDDDHFFEDLSGIGEGIAIPLTTENQATIINQPDLDPETLENLVQSNEKILAALHDKLNENIPFGAAHNETIGKRLRSPLPLIHEFEDMPPSPTEFRNLKNLLIQHARLMAKNSNLQALHQDLRDLSLFSDFELQNPRMITFMTGLKTGINWLSFMANEMPPESINPALLKLIPQNGRIRNAFIQSIYLEDILMEDLLTRQIEDKEWWAFLVLNDCETMNLFYERFQYKKVALEGPLLQYQDPAPILDGKPGLFDLFFKNGLVSILMDIGAPNTANFVMRVGCYETAADVARLRILLGKTSPTRESVAQVIADNGLLNSFTGQPYVVHEDGRIILFPGQAPNSELIQILEPFDSWLILTDGTALSEE